MTPYYQKNDITIYHGDLRNVLPALPEASVDVVPTRPTAFPSWRRIGTTVFHGPEYWLAIARVCKPGAMLLSFGGTRTYHRLISAIEDAGWEIRDCLMWLYGQGLPKARDIGKLIDKTKGAVRKVVGTKLGQPGYSLADNGRTNEVYGNLHNPTANATVYALAHDGSRSRRDHLAMLDRLGDGLEAGMGATRPGDEADGRHDANNALTWGVAGMNIDACRIS